MRARKVSPEVFYSDEPVVRVDRGDIDALLAEADPMPRRRTRLCTHRSPDDRLHEMLIVHHRDAYVRAHRHLGKAESMHILRGEVDLVLFDEAGAVTEVIGMGELASGRPFYYRMSEPIYHSMLIRSEWLVFHEVTSGPLRREESEFAPWAPPDEDTGAVRTFLDAVEGQVREWRAGQSR
jgi:cupin fold WbuC family metalloprotein